MEFSSTATYANRYDLDEIDVFLEGQSTNPMFFDINGLPTNLNLGKHYFNLSLLDSTNMQYNLAPNSRVLFEVKSINNIVIKSDVSSLNQRNGLAICFLEILNESLRSDKPIEDGQGTLTIVGSLENKETTVDLIPDKFIGAMNYRCVYPIQIQKNNINANSPVITNINHSIRTIGGKFAFVSNTIPSFSTDPETGTNYDASGNPSKSARVNLEIPT